jgi:Xaa-Pro aminopeptidase
VLADDARAPAWLAEAGLSRVECDYEPAAFKEIRLVKTPAEVERLRAAALANEAACRAAAAGARVGMTQHALEMEFVCACARRGNWATYLVSDLGRLPHDAIRAGEPLMLDALSSRQGYYGDFGRTLVVGGVSAELRGRAQALDAAWAAARAAIVPGADYDGVREAAVAGARHAGFAEFGLPVAHSLGLQHTDDPAPPRLHTGINPNRGLEPGMVLNLDMPYIEWGWGALHREDTVLVTDAGCELLTSGDETLVVVA